MKKKDKQIEDVLVPENGEIRNENGALKTTIVDLELDAFECEFPYANSVIINTSDAQHITLHIDNLKQLISLIKKSEKMYKNRTAEEWAKYEQ